MYRIKVAILLVLNILQISVKDSLMYVEKLMDISCFSGCVILMEYNIYIRKLI